MIPALLLLADGTRFEGEGLGVPTTAIGEAVFYTGMTGYEEALTDPSYAGQILNFTYPLIGNYGISGAAAQHHRACVLGAVIKRIAYRPSHWASRQSLPDWLLEQGVPAIVGVDTRGLTIALREHGALLAALAVGEEAIAGAERRLAEAVRTRSTVGLVASVASAAPARTREGSGPHIVLLDCGVKRAIVRDLASLGARVSVLRFDASAEEILAAHPDALLVSPGPGDPTDLSGTIAVLRELIGTLPIFGICLGHQLLALACGAKTYKLPYGHRGGNQPVRELRTRRVLITAHNHGYAVDGASLPPDLEATMINLNDGTNEGFRHRTLPVAAIQFHPEASPGPYDARALFREWLDTIGREGDRHD
jgi:carbamoyl-phosphate synthase small subunit